VTITTLATQSPQAPTAAPENAVQTISLQKSIDERPILRDINLSIPVARYVSLLGANGAGKTTLLKILATLIPPTAGELKLFGQTVSRDGWAARRRIGLIGHQSMLYRDLSALENLIFFGRLYCIPDPDKRAKSLLKTVGLLDRADDPVKSLSRGMTQRIAIARALIHDPDLLLADEPFDGLDAPSSDALEKFLAVLHSSGKTIILANHDIAQSLRLSQRAIVLRKGQIVIDQPSSQLTSATILQEMQTP